MPARTSLPPTTVARLRLVTLRLARRIRQHTPAGITPSQLSALTAIARHGPVSLGALAEHEGVRPPSATRTVSRLERAGLVERMPGDDRRVNLVTVSAGGEELLTELRRRGTSWLADRLAILGPDDRRAIERALPALERLLASDTER